MENERNYGRLAWLWERIKQFWMEGVPCIEHTHADVLFQNEGSGRIGETVCLKVVTDADGKIAHRGFNLEGCEIIVSKSNVALLPSQNEA